MGNSKEKVYTDLKVNNSILEYGDKLFRARIKKEGVYCFNQYNENIYKIFLTILYKFYLHEYLNCKNTKNLYIHFHNNGIHLFNYINLYRKINERDKAGIIVDLWSDFNYKILKSLAIKVGGYNFIFIKNDLIELLKITIQIKEVLLRMDEIEFNQIEEFINDKSLLTILKNNKIYYMGDLFDKYFYDNLLLIKGIGEKRYTMIEDILLNL